jgi:hypothetical protein
MTVLDLFRPRPPAPPPDVLNLMSRRRLPSDIQLAQDRGIGQSLARERVLEADLVNLGRLVYVATHVVKSVHVVVEAAATYMPHERERVDSLAQTASIIANDKLREFAG